MSDHAAANDPSIDLLSAAAAAIPAWLERRIVERLTVARPTNCDQVIRDEVTRDRIRSVVRDVSTSMVSALAALLTADVDAQPTSPLAAIRAQLGPVTELLVELQVAPPPTDKFERRNSPDDLFRVGPMTWADIDPSLHEPGLRWGAWKAFTVMSRHG